MEVTPHIIVVDDDSEICQLLSNFLTKHNYRVSTAQNGVELLQLLDQCDDVGLVVLDIMMPGIDGFEVCKRIRVTSDIPIIILTAVSESTDRIIGLEFGADDYLTKPFNPRELLARIKAILRRSYEKTPFDVTANQAKGKSKFTSFNFADWSLNTTTRCLLSPANVEVALSSRSYDLLVIFLEHPQHVLSRDHLLDILSNRSAEPFDRSIDVQVSRLRQKLDDDSKYPKLIKTVRNGGYFFAASVTKA